MAICSVSSMTLRRQNAPRMPKALVVINGPTPGLSATLPLPDHGRLPVNRQESGRAVLLSVIACLCKAVLELISLAHAIPVVPIPGD